LLKRNNSRRNAIINILTYYLQICQTQKYKFRNSPRKKVVGCSWIRKNSGNLKLLIPEVLGLGFDTFLLNLYGNSLKGNFQKNDLI